MPRWSYKRYRYTRAVYGPQDRRFPKRDADIEAMYPGHFLPTSVQLLEELLRRSLELERSRRRQLILVAVEAADTTALRAA